MTDRKTGIREERPGEAGADHGSESTSEWEPVTTGTLFLMIVFLTLLVGMWGMVYWILLER